MVLRIAQILVRDLLYGRLAGLIPGSVPPLEIPLLSSSGEKILEWASTTVFYML
jgi:hypothetical protein